MRGLLVVLAATFLLWSGSSKAAGLGPMVHHHRLCQQTAGSSHTTPNLLTGQPDFVVSASTQCQGLVPMDQRICPQLKVNGHWLFIRSADGYGTCHDMGWSGQQLDGYTMDFGCTAYPQRAYVVGWIVYGGKMYSTVTVSKSYTCASSQ